MKSINVILSGGVGSRLWPLSRKARPKQYLPIFEGKTLFQKTVSRNRDFCDEVLVVGNSENYLLSRNDLQNAGVEQYQEIIEACPRNTAAAIAFAAFSVKPDDVLFVTPSDHLISITDHYSESVNRAKELAMEGYLVTFGLKPTHPETGFGYIESVGEDVISFREKPDLETANQFLEKGNFLWNSGMFCFKAGIFLEELKKYEPLVFQAAFKALNSAKDGALDFTLSMEIPSISIDYAVMERSKKVKVVSSEFDWSDMGSFESIYSYFIQEGYPTDANGNMVIGTEIHSEFVGLKDTILIYTPDALLVLRKDKAQDVKKVFEKLEKEKPELV